jgi:hypothetical protein
VVTKAYEASKAPTQAVPKQVSAPPAIMSATGTGDVQERKGMADASKLGDMSPEEKASWFIQNQFV